MNVKSIFGTIGDTLTGLFGVLTGLVGVGIMSQVIFGTGWMYRCNSKYLRYC